MNALMLDRSVRVLGAACGLAVSGACLAQADSFHVMQIQMAIGGVGGNTAAQAVQLRQSTSFQHLVQFGVLKAWDAAGENPVVLIAPPTQVQNFETGDAILFTTTAFDAATSPACVPDFHMNPIPASYLAAGRLTWEDTIGTVYWSLAWGGAAYTGSNMGSFTNNPTGNFGPAFAGPLPSGGVQALAFLGPATAQGGANATDYALTTGAAAFTNNSHATFTVAGGPAPCYANCDGSTIVPVLNVLDFNCFLNRFASGHTYANCDGSTIVPVLNVLDFNCFLNRFAAGCP